MAPGGYRLWKLTTGRDWVSRVCHSWVCFYLSGFFPLFWHFTYSFLRVLLLYLLYLLSLLIHDAFRLLLALSFGFSFSFLLTSWVLVWPSSSNSKLPILQASGSGQKTIGQHSGPVKSLSDAGGKTHLRTAQSRLLWSLVASAISDTGCMIGVPLLCIQTSRVVTYYIFLSLSLLLVDVFSSHRPCWRWSFISIFRVFRFVAHFICCLGFGLGHPSTWTLRHLSFLFVSHFLLLFFDMCFVNLYIRIASFVLVPTPMVGLHLEFSSLLKSFDWSRRDGQPFYFSNVQWAARSHDHCSWKCSFHVMRFRVREVWSSNLSPTLRWSGVRWIYPSSFLLPLELCFSSVGVGIYARPNTDLFIPEAEGDP